MLVKLWNSIGNRRGRTPNLSLRAPLFIICLCLQSRKDVSGSLITSSIPCRQIETFLCKNIFFMPAGKYKAEFGLAIKIYSVLIFILNNSAIWRVNAKPQNKQMHCQISPKRMCDPRGCTMKIRSRYHRLLIYDVKGILK